MQTNYDILDWADANELKSRMVGEVVDYIDFNLSRVYELSDGTYLVMPINPFAKCLATKDAILLEKWRTDCYYPTNEKVNAFYFANKEKFENLPQFQEVLISELLKYLEKYKSELTQPPDLDEICRLLKKKKAFNKYKLNFIVLMGCHIINKYPDDGLNWAKLVDKQLLNPLVTLVLSRVVNNEDRYFNLQYLVDGKWGYSGLQDIEHQYKYPLHRPDEIVSLQKFD
ncbi:hypothetical protein [Mucilaginibacter psychrotolerans]|uniref:Uncharacterized protein n=1 Tax=Mucilaginibacter psychrotolerans TaxID=1524096 RepID=A0A4Y8SBR6_9SPHI|nr:hypothetical protein [Mucilaginibacter psychrotolerans]TFF36342.1 hypothetical protein E2R66_16025 [Mucilaginibacter psychrotolerans]